MRVVRALGSAALLGPVVGCTSSGPGPGVVAASPTTQAAHRTGSVHQLYVSVGDSYAAGVQPASAGTRIATRHGFAYQLVTAAQDRGYEFSLVNFGCGGATTASVLHDAGCRSDKLGPGATPYPLQTQAAAAEDFLRAHRGRVGLITVVLGLNDLGGCLDLPEPTPCVAEAATQVKANLATLLGRLRAAAGPAARIVGLSYPDVFLGAALHHSGRRLARASVRAFQSQLNPALKSAYEGIGGAFVDVTRVTGGYGSWIDTTTVAPYGQIPVPVAEICDLTYYCTDQDVHPRTNGYALIARHVLARLPAS